MPGPAFRRGESVSLHTVEEEDLPFLQRLRNDPAVRLGTAFSAPENADELEEWFEEEVSALEDEEAQFLVVPQPDGPRSSEAIETPADGRSSATDRQSDATAAGDGDAMDADAPDGDAIDGDAAGEGDVAEGPEPVGFVSLFNVERPASHAEVACYVDPAQRGSGYAVEATELLVGYAIEERRLHKVAAGALATDEDARRVLATVGFTEEETRRKERLVDGEFVDVLRHSILEDEWDGV